MNYFVAYTLMSEGANLFYNTVLEVDKSIETIKDIQNMEDSITKSLNAQIKDDIEKGKLEEIKGVKIINYKEIGKGTDSKLRDDAGEVKSGIKTDRKKTTVPDKLFDNELSRANKRILRMLRKY